jgi:hypothetical protein
MAALISARVHIPAAGVAEAAGSVAAEVPAEDGWPELPVQPTRSRIRDGQTTSRMTAARPCRRVSMPQVSAHDRYLLLPAGHSLATFLPDH